jgi:hypothetical protein
MRSPGVTTCSSAPCRPHTPWFEGWMDSAFVAILPTRPCPLFGRPVHRWDGSHRFRPGASPQALRISPRGGHPALLDTHRGQRGVTPAFGYGAPHPSTSGTSTHLSTSLPSAPYEPLRRLPRPSPDGGVARSPRQPDRSPVLQIHRVRTCCAHYPGEQGDRPVSMHLVVLIGLRPSRGDSALAFLAFRGLLGLHSRCGPHACEPARGGFLSPGLRWIGHPRHLPGSYQGLPTPPWTGLSPAALIHLSRRTLELPILALNPVLSNVARRQPSDLR